MVQDEAYQSVCTCTVHCTAESLPTPVFFHMYACWLAPEVLVVLCSSTITPLTSLTQPAPFLPPSYDDITTKWRQEGVGLCGRLTSYRCRAVQWQERAKRHLLCCLCTPGIPLFSVASVPSSLHACVLVAAIISYCICSCCLLIAAILLVYCCCCCLLYLLVFYCQIWVYFPFCSLHVCITQALPYLAVFSCA